MKRVIFVLLVIAIVTSAQAKYSGGTGDPNNPYQIATKADLLALAADINDYSKCFILTADIDMEGQAFTMAIIAANTTSGNNFQGSFFNGTFDGNDHKITDFTINGGNNNCFLGLFGIIYSGGLIKNLGLENFSVSGLSGSYYVGGLVGYNDGSISNCHSTGSVSGTSYVGGLVGFSVYGSISNCYSTGAVSGSFGSYYVGGLVGYNTLGNISNCYSTGLVSGSSDVGGLVGKKSSGTISSSYFLITSGSNNGYGTPLTDTQMKQQGSFAGWDFSDVWHICETANYPKLKWQIVPGDFVCPDGVNFADYSFFAERWLNTDCASNNNCDGADLDLSGTVDMADLAIMCDNWLKGF
ncbi:MAG: GLUG motif-containing protein [Sedimentisphaerales bacterium]